LDKECPSLAWQTKKIEEDNYLPYVSPMLAPYHAGLPKALIIGAEFDGLRIQTEVLFIEIAKV
jgi:acetyl esterase/lipase